MKKLLEIKVNGKSEFLASTEFVGITKCGDFEIFAIHDNSDEEIKKLYNEFKEKFCNLLDKKYKTEN